MEKKYQKGEVVWAKVRGFPWWPGVIQNILRITKVDEEEGFMKEIKETKIKVSFVGDNSYAELPLNKIEKFQTKFDEYSKTKKKSLLNSIKLAKKIISGEIPFEKHLSYALKKSNEDNDKTKGDKRTRKSESDFEESSDDYSNSNDSSFKNISGEVGNIGNITGDNIERLSSIEDDWDKNLSLLGK
jgi:hypothetical protein